MTKRRVPDITDEEEAQVQRWIAEDPDDWEATDEELANAMSFEEAEPELAASILRDHPELAEPMRKTTEKLRRRRGRPPVRGATAANLDPPRARGHRQVQGDRAGLATPDQRNPQGREGLESSHV